jgi:hypothetical protein
MNFFETLNNNFKHDIWGNFQMSRQLGPMVGYGYLAKKSLALARAVFSGRTVTVGDKQFFDTWS